MKNIILTFLSCFFLSCSQYEPPKNFYVDSGLQIDSIEAEYILNNKKYSPTFKTLGGLSLGKKYIKIDEKKINLYNPSEDFFVVNDTLARNGDLLGIEFFNEKAYNIKFFSWDGYNSNSLSINEINNDLQTKNKIDVFLNKDLYKNNKNENLEVTFRNLKNAFLKKYGMYNYYYKGDFYPEKDYKGGSIAFVWLVNGIKIKLSLSIKPIGQSVTDIDGNDILIKDNQVFVEFVDKSINVEFVDLVQKNDFLKKYNQKEDERYFQKVKIEQNRLRKIDSINNLKTSKIYNSL